MSQDDLKKYTVVVENGSGCFFQPLTIDYTYIITAKHLFFDEKEIENGQIQKQPKGNGSKIKIEKQVHDGNTWNLETIPFQLQYSENYFPHDEADIAIIKLPFEEGFNMINIDEDIDFKIGSVLCGFPGASRENAVGEWYQTKDIQSFGASGNYSQSAQLVGNFDQKDIEGMSGGGLLKLNGEGISFIGIQSKMASQQYPAGKIGFIQAKYAKQIIEYEKNAGKLERLFPNTLANFSFLRNSSFILEVDALDAQNAEDARTTLLNKAQHIIDSGLTPIGIKELFKDRLLLNEKEVTCLGFNSVWIAWLEFLTIMNIAKFDNIDITNLSEIFNTYRLKYVNSEDWTENVSEVYGKSNYLGMKPDSTVIVSSKNPAKTSFIIPKGKLIDINRPYDKTGFRTDMGLHPLACFDFVHIDYFKKKCIVQKISEFQNLTEQQIIDKLKHDYNELFN